LAGPPSEYSLNHFKWFANCVDVPDAVSGKTKRRKHAVLYFFVSSFSFSLLWLVDRIQRNRQWKKLEIARADTPKSRKKYATLLARTCPHRVIEFGRQVCPASYHDNRWCKVCRKNLGRLTQAIMLKSWSERFEGKNVSTE